MPNKTRTLVKLDDKVIEIKEDKNGQPRATALSEDELCEVSLLDEGIEKLIENDLNKLANEAYEELKQSFKKQLKTNVLGIVGFNDSWGKWEVDHCNGRSSLITALISNKVQELIRAEFEKIAQPEMADLLKDMQKTIRAEFKKTFLYEVERSTREKAKIAATNFLQDLLSKEFKKHQKKAMEATEQAFYGRKKKQAVETDDD